MHRPPDTLPPDLPLARLRRINDLCNRFEAAWKSGPPPAIEAYAGGSADSLELRHLVLIDIDYRRLHGDAPRAEDYQARFPDLDGAWLAAALAEAGPTAAAPTLTGHDIPASTFLDRVAQERLLSDDDLGALRERIATAATTTEALARWLVAQGKLAEYQARALAAPVPVPLVLGPYLLDGWIGAGGMGAVFRATHGTMKRVVAVKVIQAELATRPEVLRRFQHEVEVAARLRHPNIVTAFDAGEQDGIAYLVTEFVDGDDLGRLVRREGPLPVERAVAFVRQAGLGLAYAHAQGIVHRDVKPSNLILGRDGVVRVLDLGLARVDRPSADGPAVSTLTEVGAVLGTAAFMAPEQARDPRSADARSDIYSLGCTLHYLLTGRPPYEAETTLALVLAHERDPIPSLRTTRPEIPEALDRLFQRMIARSPDQRPPDLAAVLKALDGPPGVTRRRVLVAAALGVAALAGAIGIGVRRRHSDPDPPTRPPLPRIPFDARAEQQRWANALGIPARTTNVVGMPLVLVPPGSFTMGTPEAALQERLRGVTGDQARFLRSEVQREAVVAEPFYLSATEVTVGLFRRFVESSRPRHVPRSEQDGGWGWHPQQGWRFAREFSWHNPGQLILTDDHPVANVDWDDAEAFCRWLTKQTESVCRLPTEVEWEFACRAGSAGLWCFGDDVDDLPLYAWTADDSGDVPQPVAGKRPNAFGLFDMHGNQLEWCRLATGDQLPVDERPVRGGRFRANPDHTRSGARRWHRRFDLVPGFRVLQVVPARS